MKQLKGFPWATYARSESESDFWKNVRAEIDRISFFKAKPKISLVVLAKENTKPKSLLRTLESIQKQSYPFWELSVVGAKQSLRETVLADKDVPFPIQWKGASVLAAVEKADGAWVGFLDAGDVLSPTALYQFALEINRGSQDILYSFEASVSEDGKKATQFLAKPELSWVTLLHSPYVGRFWLGKKDLVLHALNEESKEFGEYGLLLRLYEKTKAWGLLPQYLYYRVESSSVGPVGAAELETVKAHLEREKFPADCRLKEKQVRVTPKVRHPEKHKVSAIVCFYNQAEWTIRCLKNLSMQLGKIPVEIILVDHDSRPEECEKVIAALEKLSIPYQKVDYHGPFNFAYQHNLAIQKHATGDLILFLNNDAFLEGENAIDEMAAWALWKSAGTVGIKLLYPDGRVQHTGLHASFGGGSRLVRLGNHQDKSWIGDLSREVFGSTFAICMVRREVYDKVGGLRELELINGFGDVAFNLQCIKEGYRNIYLGHLKAKHVESGTRGLTYEYWEECRIEKEFPELLQKMVRQDLSLDCVPQPDYSLSKALEGPLRNFARRNLPFLRDWKHQLGATVQEIRSLRSSYKRSESN